MPFPDTTALSDTLFQQCVDGQNDMVFCDTVVSQGELNATVGQPLSYVSGLPPEPLSGNIGKNSGLLVLVIAMFLLATFNFGSYRKVLASFAQTLKSARQQSNLFDDTLTAGETRVMLILIFQLCLCMGILLYVHFSSSLLVPENHIMIGIMVLLILFAVYYLLQLGVYEVIGYLFTDSTSASQWLKGFHAIHSFLGLSLVLPALISVFYPSASLAMVIIAASFYIIARILFIYKSLRIFYHNFSSLLYFILYLCAIEIIPVKLFYSSALFLIDKTL